MSKGLTLDLRIRLLTAVGAGGLAALGASACGARTGTDLYPGDAARDAPADAGVDAAPARDSAAEAATPPSRDAGGPFSARRPFLVGASLRHAHAAANHDWARDIDAPLHIIGARTAEMLGEVWLVDALEEHASIAAFARFTMMLLAVGAPPDLVVASQRASLDEVAHARECFGLAARYSGRREGPGPLEVHDSLGATSLAELAALTTEEGCIGETLGAVLAREQLEKAADPEACRVLRRIAADETRHAELAWKFVRWAVGRGGREVLGAVERSAAAAIAGTRATKIRDYGVELATWRAHGRLTCVEARTASERGIQEIIEPCLAALSAIV